MNTYTNLNGREDLLASITALEQELAAKTGKEVSLVAYSPIRYASLTTTLRPSPRSPNWSSCFPRKPARKWRWWPSPSDLHQ